MVAMDISDDEIHAFRIFYPYAAKKREEMRARSGRFVHYTTAATAVNMLKSQEVWMRNATTMNDFMEVDHGWNCLLSAYKGEPGMRLRAVLERLHPGFCDDVAGRFDKWMPKFKANTYIACISEHDDDEDRVGRLSMWRAYGGVSGVALVLNHTPFLTPSNAIKAYTSPVAYLNEDQFVSWFYRFVDLMEMNREFLARMDRNLLMANMFGFFRAATLCTKHQGFREEREWRVVHCPSFEPCEKLIPELQDIRGIPQLVYKIPLKNVPEEGFVGAEIPELLDRIIIGPTQYPLAMYDTFVTLLERVGVADASNKVWVSDIPLRQ